VTAFLFGPDGRRLYGYHHPPANHSLRGVVVCPPWGAEYEYAHRSLLVLARRLAGVGLHVLRFDYSATGDSYGDSDEADLDRWVDDTDAAVEELRAMSGVEEVDLVGLRIGGVVAARTAPRRPDTRRLVLWDPIRDGSRWVADLGGVEAGRDETVELGRYTVSPAFVDQLHALAPTVYDRLAAHDTLLLTTGTRHPDPEPRTGQNQIEYRTLDQPRPWIEDQSIWAGQVPMESIDHIVEWLT